MGKGKAINILIVVVVITVLTCLSFLVRIKPTADNVAVLKTSGMTCGSCSSTIQKAVESKKGVSSVEVDVPGGWVVVAYDSKKVKPELVASAVTGAGFPSRISEVLTIERFRAITGRNPGKGTTGKGCGCGNGK